MCVQVIAQGIISVNGFDHPSTLTSNVPTMVGMLLLYNRACPKGNGVLCLNRSTPDHSCLSGLLFGVVCLSDNGLLLLELRLPLGLALGRNCPHGQSHRPPAYPHI